MLSAGVYGILSHLSHMNLAGTDPEPAGAAASHQALGFTGRPLDHFKCLQAEGRERATVQTQQCFLKFTSVPCWDLT